MHEPPVPRLASLATAVPRHVLEQDEVAAAATAIFGLDDPALARLLPVFRNAGIARRQSAMPLDWFRTPHGFGERNAIYLEVAVDLLEAAARTALERAGLAADEIDGVVTVSTSGIATPSLDARLMGRLGLREDAARLPVFGLGCGGGVLGLARAAQMAKGDPGGRYLLLVVELCTLNFRHGDRGTSNIVATALFGDGAAAAVVSCRADGPALAAWGEHTWPSTLDIMGWDVGADGLSVVFSRDIPALARRDLRPVVDRFLARHGLTRRDIDGYACHPGGTKVVDALEHALELAPGALDTGRAVLRDHGNMSAATVLFVLERTLAEGPRKRTLATAFGPGFSAGMLLLEER